MSLLHRIPFPIPEKSNLFNPKSSHFIKSPSVLPHTHLHFINLASSNYTKLTSFKPPDSAVKAINYDAAMLREEGLDLLGFDRFLSILEFLSLASSVVVSVGFAVSCSVLGSKRAVDYWVGSKFLAWQVVVLVGGVVIGAWIRRRQWQRICREEERVGGGSEGLNLVSRVHKLEEDVRSSVTILRVLSRQVEKLGIRFRVSRKSLKEPIAETASLAKKNSEATRALALQEDILEKELGEVQKVLMAMQEQQQKQLELILAIAKSGKLLHNKPNQDVKETRTREPILPKAEPIYAMDTHKETQ